jgi:hypothetical protein
MSDRAVSREDKTGFRPNEAGQPAINRDRQYRVVIEEDRVPNRYRGPGPASRDC